MTSNAVRTFRLQGAAPTGNERLPSAFYRVATARYAETIALPVLRGRFIASGDRTGSVPVVVVNERFAEAYWPGQDAMGKQIAPTSDDGLVGPWHTVVGVVGNVHHDSPLAEPAPEMYFPLAQRPQAALYLALRTAVEPATLGRTLEAVANNLDPEVPLNLVRSMDQVMAAQRTPTRITAGLMSIFSGIALLLAATGLYGVIAYLVGQRTHEFGIRLALGARDGDLLRLVLRRSLALTSIGTALGLAGAAAVARILKSAFEGIQSDPEIFTLVAVLLAAVAIGSSWIPLRRALASGPLSALRRD